jgi:hypothetical protein
MAKMYSVLTLVHSKSSSTAAWKSPARGRVAAAQDVHLAEAYLYEMHPQDRGARPAPDM